MIKQLKGSSQQVRRAHLVLKADADGPAWTDGRRAEACHCRVHTIENVRKRLVTAGCALARAGKKRETPPTPPRLDGAGAAPLSALRLGPPPAGYGRWTWHVLADALVAREMVASLSLETVRKRLKKTAGQHGGARMG